jgi:hypothetical protein
MRENNNKGSTAMKVNEGNNTYTLSADVQGKTITKKYNDGKIEVISGKEFDREWNKLSLVERTILEFM